VITSLDFGQCGFHTVYDGVLDIHHSWSKGLIELYHIGFALLQIAIDCFVKPISRKVASADHPSRIIINEQ